MSFQGFSGVFRFFHRYIFTVTKVFKNSCIASDYLVPRATYPGPINNSDNDDLLSRYKLLNDRVLFFQKHWSDLSRSHKYEQQITRDQSTLYRSLLTNTLDIHTYVYVCIHICHTCTYVCMSRVFVKSVCVYVKSVCVYVVSRAKWPNVKKCSLEIRFARRSDARLPYPTLTGWHQVCITRQDDPALRIPTNRGRETHLFASSVPPLRLTSTRGRTDDSEHSAWQALGIIS